MYIPTHTYSHTETCTHECIHGYIHIQTYTYIHILIRKQLSKLDFIGYKQEPTFLFFYNPLKFSELVVVLTLHITWGNPIAFSEQTLNKNLYLYNRPLNPGQFSV